MFCFSSDDRLNWLAVEQFGCFSPKGNFVSFHIFVFVSIIGT